MNSRDAGSAAIGGGVGGRQPVAIKTVIVRPAAVKSARAPQTIGVMRLWYEKAEDGAILRKDGDTARPTDEDRLGERGPGGWVPDTPLIKPFRPCREESPFRSP